MRRSLPEAELIAVYQETIRPLYAFASRRVGGDREMAEDLVQETWMRAVEDWSRRGAPDRPLAWLQQVARNTLAGYWRRTRPSAMDPAEIDLEDERFRPDTPDAAALINWGLARLRRRQAELIEAFHFEGKTVEEIAVERGISARAVEGRLRRARIKLRNLLAPHLRATTGGIENARSTRAG